MTGHLVFSTLHTNDALSALTRLVDLEVPRYVASGALEAVLAQRLVRRICLECRETHVPDSQTIARLVQHPVGEVELARGRGCGACRATGYHGRTAIFELFVVTEEITQAIAHDAPVARLREMARASGMRTLAEDGWVKAQAGITTVEEVLRVTDH
jgi:type II secretory ATPase GspE/PulE/Tfp pilus assembly ATPase PilB-like protein